MFQRLTQILELPTKGRCLRSYINKIKIYKPEKYKSPWKDNKKIRLCMCEMFIMVMGNII